MHTVILESHEIKKGAQLLKKGQLVVFPTETVYGLGASLLFPRALESIFAAKGRPGDNPLILHVERMDQAMDYGHLSPEAVKLAEIFWPGPLTLVVPKKPNVPSVVCAGLPTVALRCPGLEMARELIRLCGAPVAAPSANRSGSPSPTTFSMALDAMEGRVEGILQGPDCEKGLESTIVSFVGPGPQILRPGSITPEQIRKALELGDDYPLLPQEEKDYRALAPGMKHAHYRPKGPVKLFNKPLDLEILDQGLSLGILSKDFVEPGPRRSIRQVGTWEEMAQVLFKSFFEWDQKKVDLILVQKPPQGQGIEPALLNRLFKASEETLDF